MRDWLAALHCMRLLDAALGKDSMRSDLDLQVIKGCSERTHPPPWNYLDRYNGIGFVDAGDEYIVQDTDLLSSGYDHACVRENDVEFITHARTDIPTLIAEIETLRAKC